MKYFTFLFYLSVVTGVYLTSCAASNSNKRNGEHVVIQPILTPEENPMAIAPVLSAVIPFAVNIGYQQVTSAFKNSGEKYTANYTASATETNFYKVPDGEETKNLNLNVKGFKLLRTIKLNNEDKVACTLEMMLGGNVNAGGISMLYLVPEYLKIDYAKAKVQRKEKEVSLKIDIDLMYFYYDKEGKFQNQTLELISGIPSVVLGQEYKAEDLEQYKTQWFPCPKVSETGVINIQDFGNYYIQFTITETDEFGGKLVKRSETVNSYREDFIKIFNTLIKDDE